MLEQPCAKTDAFRLCNAIEELTKMLSDRIWDDETIQDRFAMAALVDGARVSAKQLYVLVETAHLQYRSEIPETGDQR
ncbi:hypothetical protein [Methylomonas sp. MgM2]